MTRMSRPAAVLVTLAIVTGCAPRMTPPAQLDLAGREARYRQELSQRRALGAAVAADLALWVERGSDRLPGAQASLMLAAPDRLRLRVASMFGTALDLSVVGDSLTAYLPGWRTGMHLGSVRESLGVEAPGDLVYRVMAAAWEPTAESWRRAHWNESLLEVDWTEGDDSLTLAVAADGLPAWVRVNRSESMELRARYHGWDRASGTPWPAVLALEDLTHDVRMRCRASRLRFEPRADPARLAVRVPPGARVLTLERLRDVLDQLGVSR